MSELKTEARKLPRPLLAALPLIMLAGLVAVLIAVGPKGLFPGEFPPGEDVTITQTTLSPDEIEIEVVNGGPEPVTIAQVFIDEAYWIHTVEPSRTIPRLGSATIHLEYPWVEGEPVGITLVSSSGVTFEHEIEVAVSSPEPDGRFLLTFTMLGLYIGLIPVLMGMLWLPFMRTLSRRWIVFFLSFTAGILIFLGVEALLEASEQSETLPTAFGGMGLVAATAIGSFALLLAASSLMRSRSKSDSVMITAYAVAAGIGLHNLGEGLAVGAAYRLGEIALGTFLVIGFAIHNTTEGLGIVSILSDRKTRMATLLALGAIAGLPTILGAWGGAYLFSPQLATIFLAIAAGAIAEVVVEVYRLIDQEEGGIRSIESLMGLAVGVIVMYLTGLLIAA